MHGVLRPGVGVPDRQNTPPRIGDCMQQQTSHAVFGPSIEIRIHPAISRFFLKRHLRIIAVANVLIEAVKALNVSVVEVVRGQVSASTEPPLPGHLGVENQASVHG